MSESFTKHPDEATRHSREITRHFREGGNPEGQLHRLRTPGPSRWIPAFAGVSVLKVKGYQVVWAQFSTQGVPRRATACSCSSSFRISATRAALPGLPRRRNCRQKTARALSLLRITKRAARYKARRPPPVRPGWPGSPVAARCRRTREPGPPGSTAPCHLPGPVPASPPPGGRNERAHARHTAVQLHLPRQLVAALQGGLALLVQAGNFLIQPGYVPPGGGPGGFRQPLVQPVEFLHPLVDQLIPAPQQVLEFSPLRVRRFLGRLRRRIRQGKHLAKPGQRLRVQAAGLRLAPAGPGEGPHLVGVDQMSAQPGFPRRPTTGRSYPPVASHTAAETPDPSAIPPGRRCRRRNCRNAAPGRRQPTPRECPCPRQCLLALPLSAPFAVSLPYRPPHLQMRV